MGNSKTNMKQNLVNLLLKPVENIIGICDYFEQVLVKLFCQMVYFLVLEPNLKVVSI